MASYCNKCSKLWDGSVPFITCEICTSTFDIDCVKVTKTTFNTMANGKNWSWKCDSCRYSSYRVMSNNLKELKKVVDLVRTELEQVKNLILSTNNTSLASTTGPINPSLVPASNSAFPVTNTSTRTIPKPKNSVSAPIAPRTRGQLAKTNNSDSSANLNTNVDTAESSVTLEAATVQDKKWFYVSNFKPSTSENMVKQHICNKMNVVPPDIIVKCLLKRDHDPAAITFISFKVGFNVTADTSEIFNIWPANISTSVFVPKNDYKGRHH